MRNHDRNMRFLALLLLAACATPAPQFFGAERHEVTRGGVRFVIFHSGYLTRAERADVPRLMEEAAAEATGCQVIRNSMKTRIPGDTGEARFALDCRT